MSGSSTNLNVWEADIPMFQALAIGDPWYLEEYAQNSIRLNELVYQRECQLPRWKARIRLVHSHEQAFFADETLEFQLNSLIIAGAPAEQALDTHLSERYFQGQTPKTFEIGVDTACYFFESDLASFEVQTGGDGSVGSVTELYRGERLEGVIVELSLGDLKSFDQWLPELEAEFNVRFKKVG